MKVLLISASYLPHRGGVSSVVKHLTDELVEQGHKIRILANRFPRILQRTEIIQEAQVDRLFFLHPEISQLIAGRFDLWFAGWWFRFWTQRKLRKIILQFQPDIINNHYLNEVAEITGLCLQSMQEKIPWIISLHGGDVDGEPLQNEAKRKRFGKISRQADRLTACSQFLAEQAIALEPSLKGKIEVLHNGVDVERFTQAVGSVFDKPYIFAVGQLAAHKGFDLLIEAFSVVHAAFPEVRLKIAGGGPQEEELISLIAKLGIQDSIELLGSQPEEKVASLMKGSIFVAMPSRREPFGIVALEAMAAGKNLLVSPVGGIPEFVPREGNLFIAPSLEDWKAGLRKFLQLWQDGGLPDTRKNLEAANKLTWRRYAEEMVEIYEDAS